MRYACIADQPVPDLGAGHQHEIKQGALAIEAYRSVARAVAGVDDLQIVEPVSGLEHQRRLFRHDQRVEATEKFEIVAIEQRLGHGNCLFEASRSKPRCRRLQPQRRALRRPARCRQAARSRPRSHPCQGQYDLVLIRRQHFARNRQAMRQLMRLIVVEEEADAFHESGMSIASCGRKYASRRLSMGPTMLLSPPNQSAASGTKAG